MTIHVEDLKFKCIIGILDFERTTHQDVIINVTIKYKYKKQFIDYTDVVNIIKSDMTKKKFLLLEDAIDSINLKLKKTFRSIKNINIKITKPSILADCRVSVSNF